MWTGIFDVIEESFLNLSKPESIYSFSSPTNNEEFEITFDNSALKQYKYRLAACNDILSLFRHFIVKNKATQQVIPIRIETPPEMLIRQFVSAVIESSGHFGQTYPNEYESYYSDQNVIGKPNVYPGFGDSPKTWCTTDTTNTHHIIVKYETALMLHSIGIYETYTHNLVSSISAFNYEKQDWQVLFERNESYYFPPAEEEEDGSFALGERSYIYRPFVLNKKDSFITDKIRIDIIAQDVVYEIDAIEMCSYVPAYHFEQEKQKNICETWFQWFHSSTSSER